MSELEYSGIPKFKRERDITSFSLTREQLNSFIDKPREEDSVEDRIFDGITRTFLKGEALKDSIGEMNPAGFIPVESESSVVVSIQRLYPDNGSYLSITFGMFKSACEFIVSQGMNIDEDWLLNYDIVDPKLEHSETVTKHKGISNDGSDWLSCFLEQLSPYAGMLIAGKMADLSFAISPQVDIDSKGGTGSFKSWGIQGMPVAIALLIELGWTLAEYNRLFKDSSIPIEVKSKIEHLSSDPKERERILTEAGYNYSSLKGNQLYNDNLAIRDYSIAYIQKRQDDLNYRHWISYSQVVESQMFAQSAASMAPVFSDKWRKIYKLGSDSVTQKHTDVFTSESSFNAIEEVTKCSLNTGLASYISGIDNTLNKSYNSIYQSLAFEIDPNIVCCLEHVLGEIDTNSLRQITSLLKISARSFYFDLDSLAAKLGDSLVIGYLNMVNCYLSQIMHNVVRDLNNKLYKANHHLNEVNRVCFGIKPITLGLNVALDYMVNFILDISKTLNGMIDHISKKQISHAENLAVTKTVVTLAAFINKIADGIDRSRGLCNLDSSFNFVTMDLPGMYPIMNMTEDARRKHFSDLPGYLMSSIGVEMPGTDSAGVLNVYQNKVPNCMDPNNISQNIAFGHDISKAMQGDS